MKLILLGRSLSGGVGSPRIDDCSCSRWLRQRWQHDGLVTVRLAGLGDCAVPVLGLLFLDEAQHQRLGVLMLGVLGRRHSERVLQTVFFFSFIFANGKLWRQGYASEHGAVRMHVHNTRMACQPCLAGNTRLACQPCLAGASASAGDVTAQLLGRTGDELISRKLGRTSDMVFFRDSRDALRLDTPAGSS